MKSLIIGIARTGKANNHILNEEMKYISMCGSKPEVSFSINCEQDEFIKEINGLRYNDADPSSSAGAISFFQELTTQIFKDLKYFDIEENDDSPLHLRLVTTPFELAQIPFEFALAPPNIGGQNKIPLLTIPERKIILTREVRQESVARYNWPSQPRILFAWAQPDPDMLVPKDDLLPVLENLVKHLSRPKEDIPYPEANTDLFLTELPNASLKSLKNKIEEGIVEKKPYTHIHILAHGGQSLQFGVTEFRLVLCEDGSTDIVEKVDGKALSQSIIPFDLNNIPAIVSLAVCDSGNVGNTIFPAGSIVYQLHNAGIPCVFASQFPLTKKGSVQMVKTLYQGLINGCDPRNALYDTRVELKKDISHDWASLVAYARFPEDINEQLQSVNLKMLFGFMKVTNAWVDHVFKFWGKIEPEKQEQALLELDSRIKQSIDGLETLLKPGNKRESSLDNELLQAEHLGLLGSAYKRKAEYLYRLIEFNPEKKPALIIQSIESLDTAREFYNCGLEANPASHWTTMQYLSLKAVIEGSLRDESELWYVTKRMAERDERRAKSEEDIIWAWGTLAELYLLKPLTTNAIDNIEDEILSSLIVAKAYIEKMANSGIKYNSAKESTVRQFERYIHWWPELFAAKYPIWLKDKAIEIKNILPSLSMLLPNN